jgi:CBS domain-containing protein
VPSWIRTGSDGYHRVESQHNKEVVMTTARDIMTSGAECIGENETLEDAARKMRDLDVGSLPICGEDNRLKGMLTDRDIVTKCVASGGDARSTRAGEFAQGEPVTIGADDPVDDVLRTMKQHKVRRLPVIDGHDLVGVVSQGDVARNIDETKVGDLVEAISS